MWVYGKEAQLVLFHLIWRANEKCLSHIVWLLVSGWKRGPLAPVVVGEGGQVNLVLTGFEGHGQSLQSFVVDLMMNQIDPPVAFPAHVASGTRMRGLQGL